MLDPSRRRLVGYVSGVRKDFPFMLKAGPAGGRLRRPSSRRQQHDGHRGTDLTLHARWCESTRRRSAVPKPQKPLGPGGGW
jgi:hypothetical protein